MTTPHVILPAASILVSSSRQRQSKPEEYIRDLAKSISEIGLIHAPTVGEALDLVAGECRRAAVLLLNQEYRYGNEMVPAGFLPVIPIAGRSEEELYQIELEENLRRKNLTAVEEARAIAELHRRLSARAKGDWTNAETGKELEKLRGEETSDEARTATQREIATSLLIDSFADDPDVMRAKTRSEAEKIAKKKLEASFTQGLGSSLAALRREDFTLHEGDCLEILPTLPSETFAGILVDPPYGIGADTFGDQAFVGDHRYADDEARSNAIANAILREGFRVTKADGHLYLFCDIRMWPGLFDLVSASGWRPFATPLIWHKPNAGHAPQPGYFTRRYECILFARKGDRKLSTSAPDVLSFPSVKEKVHAAQKPVELIEYLMKLSFFPGETVLDPCAGSGVVFAAAKASGLRAVGIELDPSSINLCRKTIGEL